MEKIQSSLYSLITTRKEKVKNGREKEKKKKTIKKLFQYYWS